ncbi:MAG TPA: methionine synthase [Nakamurella sp.]
MMTDAVPRLEIPAADSVSPLLAQFPVRRAWHAGAATGIGSLPGTSPGEAAAMVAGELPELPHLVELPARGVGADLIGRTAGLLVDIWAEVVPSGWRIARRPGRDSLRAKDFLAWDLDAAEEQFAGAEWVKVQVCGPWTLAAGLELPSGHRALTDPGAVRDLAESLVEGLRAHLAEVARRVPGAGVVIQLDEPGLPAVLAGSLPTASGFGTVPAVPGARVQELLAGAVSSFEDHPTVAHCCHAQVPLRLLRASGFDALAVDLTLIGQRPAALDALGELVDEGGKVLAGIIPTSGVTKPEAPLRTWAQPLLDTWNRLGFRRQDLAASVVPTPTCGLAGADHRWAVRAMQLCRQLAGALQDLPETW